MPTQLSKDAIPKKTSAWSILATSSASQDLSMSPQLVFLKIMNKKIKNLASGKRRNVH